MKQQFVQVIPCCFLGFAKKLACPFDFTNMSSPHGVADNDRLCLHNLSFGVSKATIVQELVNCGFSYMTEDDVHVVRKGINHREKLCTAFIKMASDADVQIATELLHGRLVPSCSWKALRAERALPRLKPLGRSSGPSSSAAPEPPTPTEGQAALQHLLHVKKEEPLLNNTFLEELQVQNEPNATKNHGKKKRNPDPPGDLDLSVSPWERRVKQRNSNADF